MRDRFAIKTGDTSPALQVQLEDESGDPIDVTNATVSFVMRKVGYPNPKIDSSAIVSIDDASNGLVSVVWRDGDTDTAGVFRGEFDIEYSDGSIETVPSDGYITIRIRKTLN